MARSPANLARNVRFFADSLWLCLFPILSAATAVFVLVQVPQGREVLRALHEVAEDVDLLGDYESLRRLLMFTLGFMAWGLANWYSARLMLERDFDFDARAAAEHEPTPAAGPAPGVPGSSDAHDPNAKVAASAGVPAAAAPFAPALVVATNATASDGAVPPTGVAASVAAPDVQASRGDAAMRRVPRPDDTRFIAWWRKVFPRALAVAPMGFVAATLLVDGGFGPAGWLSAAASGVILALIVARRWLFDIKAVSGASRLPLKVGDRVALWCALSFSVVLLLGLALVNYWIARFFGAPALMFFALGMTTLTGSVVLMYLPKSYGWPAMTWLPVIAWLAFAQFGLNRNHSVTDHPALSDGPSADRREKITEYFDRWDNKRQRKGPIVLVAAEGGASRSAWWTAHVLGAADYATYGAFSRQVLAISGVSGGSLGASTYVGLLARRAQQATADPRWRPDWHRKPEFPDDNACDRLLETRAREPLPVQSECFVGRDFLSTTLGFMLFPDFLQRFIPVTVNAWDRSRGLQETWDTDWLALYGETTFAQSLMRLYSPTEPYDKDTKLRVDLPLLLLNTTRANAGRPVYQAPVLIKSAEMDDLFAVVPAAQQLPLSVAVHNSARFPIVSPGGEVHLKDSCRTYWDSLVDGGYFENSGAFALRQMLLDLKQTLASTPGRWEDVRSRLRILVIANDYAQPRLYELKAEDGTAPASGPIDQEELMTPIVGLYQTRSSRARTSWRELADFVKPDGPAEPGKTVSAEGIAFDVPLTGRAIDLQRPSMNWYLTPKSRLVMWNALATKGLARDALCSMLTDKLWVDVALPAAESTGASSGSAQDCGTRLAAFATFASTTANAGAAP